MWELMFIGSTHAPIRKDMRFVVQMFTITIFKNRVADKEMEMKPKRTNERNLRD